MSSSLFNNSFQTQQPQTVTNSISQSGNTMQNVVQNMQQLQEIYQVLIQPNAKQMIQKMATQNPLINQSINQISAAGGDPKTAVMNRAKELGISDNDIQNLMGQLQSNMIKN